MLNCNSLYLSTTIRVSNLFLSFRQWSYSVRPNLQSHLRRNRDISVSLAFGHQEQIENLLYNLAIIFLRFSLSHILLFYGIILWINTTSQLDKSSALQLLRVLLVLLSATTTLYLPQESNEGTFWILRRDETKKELWSKRNFEGATSINVFAKGWIYTINARNQRDGIELKSRHFFCALWDFVI